MRERGIRAALGNLARQGCPMLAIVKHDVIRKLA
jgi:hypothetical protein